MAQGRSLVTDMKAVWSSIQRWADSGFDEAVVDPESYAALARAVGAFVGTCKAGSYLPVRLRGQTVRVYTWREKMVQ